MIIPAHCTGWRAVNALGNMLGDNMVVPSAVGRIYNFWWLPMRPKTITLDVPEIIYAGDRNVAGYCCLCVK